MSNIWCCYIVVESLWVILYNNLALTFTLVFPFDELFLNIIISKWFNKWTKLFLLIISSWSSRVDKDWRTEYSCQNFWLLELSFIDVKDNEEVKVDSFVIISGWWKFDCTKIDLSVYHLHLALASNTYINQCHSVSFFVLSVFLYCKNLGLT